MILTFEVNADKDEIEVIFDDQGYDILIKYLKEIKSSKEKIDHLHLMTKEWGGSELSSEVMNEKNTLINQVKMVYINDEG